MYTGERILPLDLFNVTFQQSLVAYKFVRQFAQGKRVLDIACGEGYGVNVLSDVAREVTGVDRDAPTLAHARIHYEKPHAFFIESDIFDLKKALYGRTFDITCSFQTLEHFTDQDRFLEVMKAVTKPQGKIFVSTPNKAMFSSFNPYHVKELTYEELFTLFSSHFTSFEIYGVFGDSKVIEYKTSKHRISSRILSLDVLSLRTKLPQPIVRWIYGVVSLRIIKGWSFKKHKDIVRVTTENFTVDKKDIHNALDFIVVANNV